MLRLFPATLVALVLLTAYPARAEIVIGVAGPMTGKEAWSGEQMQRGAEMAVADINAAGGVLGNQLRLVTADDFCDPQQAVVAARKLVDDGVVAVMGHYCSGASIPASKIYAEARVLQISPASTNPLLTEQGLANVFRVVARDDAQGIVAGNYLAARWGDKKIAILHDGTIYGKGLADETRKQMNERGVKENMYRAYTPGQSNYSSEIDALASAKIDVVYIGGYHTEVALMARMAHDRGYPVQFISGDDLASEEFGMIAEVGAEGTLFTWSVDPRQNPEAASVMQRLRAENFEPDPNILLAYGAVQAWAQAVKAAGSLELQQVIASLRSHQFDTVLGRIDFDEKGDLTDQTWIWYVWKAGKYVPLEEIPSR
jgi:branched-chain amino acid transport system substrate-binding protein